jgi:hypothetical protein
MVSLETPEYKISGAAGKKFKCTRIAECAAQNVPNGNRKNILKCDWNVSFQKDLCTLMTSNVCDI